MANLTTVTLASGVPTVGTGDVSTIDALMAYLAPVTPVVSSAVEGSHVLKNSAGSLSRISVLVGASEGFLMLFNATSAPADGTVAPVWCAPIYSDGTNGFYDVSFIRNPLNFSTGITAVFSTTGPLTKTISATAFFSAQVI